MPPIIFEDDYLSVIHKPVGFLAQQGNNGLPENWLPVHRLDQRVSGLLVVAKNAAVATSLSEAFANNQIDKKYKAIVANIPAPTAATLVHWLRKDFKQQKAKIYRQQVDKSKQAILDYQLLQQSEKYAMLQVQLKTGRFHQIRAQLAAIGSPIVGDVKYGYKRTTEDGSIFLQAFQLSFTHPITKEQLQYSLPIPAIWQKFGFSD